MSGIRADMLVQFLQMLNQPVGTENPDLLTVVTPIIRAIAQLPKYTSVTQELSDNAKNLRKTVLSAREPDELLFKQLPEAFGFPAFGALTTTNPKTNLKIFRHVTRCLVRIRTDLRGLAEFHRADAGGSLHPDTIKGKTPC